MCRFAAGPAEMVRIDENGLAWPYCAYLFANKQGNRERAVKLVQEYRGKYPEQLKTGKLDTQTNFNNGQMTRPAASILERVN